MVFVISELFVIVLSKCNHFVPEPITIDSKTITVLFKTTNDEIAAETQRKDKRLLLGFVLRTLYTVLKTEKNQVIIQVTIVG